jgi:FkbM family methyltransferase
MLENNIKNVTLFNNAVGHKYVNTTMSNMLYDGYNCAIEYNTNKTLNYGGIGLGEKGEPCTMLTIDSLNLEKCDYIKIDVEGAEILVLMGGMNTIQKFKPYIWIEKTDKHVTNEMKKSLNIDFEIIDTLDFLKNIGYKFRNIDDNNYLAYYS